MSAHQLLRAATRGDHDRVDALFSGFDLGDPADYRRFLIAQAAAFLPAEQALEAQRADLLFPDWPERRRGERLRADLAALDLPCPPPVPAPRLSTPAEVAGAAYVLEGSRLGGAVLARQIAPGLPCAFLAAPQPSGQWRGFLERLEQLLASHVQRMEAVKGAGQIFDCFARAAKPVVDAL